MKLFAIVALVHSDFLLQRLSGAALIYLRLKGCAVDCASAG